MATASPKSGARSGYADGGCIYPSDTARQPLVNRPLQIGSRPTGRLQR
jgi:hypothetical protein